MATVPRYSDQQVAPTGIPNVRISDAPARAIAQVGESIGRGVGALGQVTHQFARQEQEKADTARLMEAQQAMSQLDMALLTDPEKGAFAQRGKNAIGLANKVLPEWDRQASSIADGLPARLRARFDGYVMQRRESAAGRLATHTMQEGNRYYADVATQTMQTMQSEAITNRMDPALVDQSATRAMQAATEAANRLGLDAEPHAKAALSATYRGVAEALLQDDPNAAAARYTATQQFMTGEDQRIFEGKLRPYLLAEDARGTVDAWLTGGGVAPGAMPVEGAAKTAAEAEAIARASVGRTIGLESGGKADARNPLSSAVGNAQFLKATWLDVVRRNFPDVAAGKSEAELLALRTDPSLSKRAAEAYAVENAQGLFQSGLPVTPETVYLAHRFGLQGARQVLRAQPDTPIARVVGAAAMEANPDLRGKTVAEVSASHAARAGETGIPVSGDGKPDWAALAERANALPNPLQRQAVMQEIGRRQALANAAETQQNRAMLDAIYTAAYAAPVGQSPDQYLSPEQLAWAQRENRVETLVAIGKRRAEDTLVQTDPIIADALEREAVTDPGTFAKRNLLEYGEQLSTQDLASLRSKQASILKGDTAAQADWATEAQRIDMGIRGLGWDKLKKNDPKVGAFGAAYRQAKQAFIQSQGKKPTPEQEDALLRNVQRNWANAIAAGREPWKETKAAESLAAGAPVRGKEGDVQLTAQDRLVVTAALRQRLGREPTEAQILAAAGAFLAGGMQ